MLLLAIERCVQRAKKGLTGGWGLFATALGFSLIGCFPEMAYLNGLLGLSWSLLRYAQLGEYRREFAVKLLGGALLALMITLPVTRPFVQYLSLTGGIANRAAADLGLQAPHYAMLLMPALYGPPFWGGRYDLWATFVGGYMDVALVAFMLLGVVQSGLREAGLRIMLTVWIVVAMLKVVGAPFVTPLLNHLPLMRMVQFYRYGQRGIEMAAIILAAIALDAWTTGQKPPRVDRSCW